MAAKIIFIDETTAQVSKDFMKKACVFGTEEFKLWREYLTYYPNAVMATKTIKKKQNKTVNTRNMTYENMAAYIRVQSDAAEVMIEFQKQIQLSKVQNNPYRAVLAWFMQKYKNVNDYTEFFEKLAEEKKKQNDMFAVSETETTNETETVNE